MPNKKDEDLKQEEGDETSASGDPQEKKKIGRAHV